MKASILIGTYNKNDELPNVLYSISRQKTTFPFEVCIVDDCSDVDPEPIVKKFLPGAKYRRLNARRGSVTITKYCMELIDPKTDVVIMQSADVIQAKEDTVEELCKNVGPKLFSVAEVRNADVHPYMYNNFDLGVQEIMHGWDKAVTRCAHSKKSKTEDVEFILRNSKLWYFFLGAMRRTDIESKALDIRGRWCDAMLRDRLKTNGFMPNLLEHVKGIHQLHPPTWVPCGMMEECGRLNCKLRKHFLGDDK
jgi:hypothetical protein